MQDWPVRVAKHGVRVVHDYLCGNAATDQWDIYNAVITTPNPGFVGSVGVILTTHSKAQTTTAIHLRLWILQ